MSAELAAYDATIAELGTALRLDGDRLDTATVRVLEENLAIIDRAIAEARTALEQDPASRYLNGHLGRTLRRKVDLLQRAVVGGVYIDGFRTYMEERVAEIVREAQRLGAGDGSRGG